MISKTLETLVARWVAAGSALIALLVTSTISYDPVNVSKLLLGSGVGLAGWVLFLGYGLRSTWRESKLVLISIFIFIIFGINSLIFATQPLDLAFYGVFGRNNGFLCYLALTGVFIATTLIRDKKNFSLVVKALIVAGAVNVVYCAFAWAGFDIIAWNNIYKTILGTFGNPNFISSFLGFYVGAALSMVLRPHLSLRWRLFGFSSIVLAITEINKSNSVQGFVVAAFAISFVLYFYIANNSKLTNLRFPYLGAILTVGGLAVAGIFQRGPLKDLLYSPTVSFRGQYWKAGINMGMDNPLTGVGWDRYGDWYRRSREAQAMITPGPDVVTNTAHNVVIDIFASGGFPLLLSYLSILGLTSIAFIRLLRRTKIYDPIFVALSVGWFSYQGQSLISINQIGIAIWGWLFGGALIAYERATRETLNAAPDLRSKSKSSANDALSGYIVGIAGFIVGILIALPPFIADAQWRKGLNQKNGQALLNLTKQFPFDPFRNTNIAILFEQSNLPNEAVAITRDVIEKNPDYFDAWNTLRNLKGSTQAERDTALKKVQELDPRNDAFKNP